MKAARGISVVLGIVACFAGTVASSYLAMGIEGLWSSGAPLWSRILDVLLSGALTVGGIYMGLRLMKEPPTKRQK
jgi:hypothetical protein